MFVFFLFICQALYILRILTKVILTASSRESHGDFRIPSRPQSSSWRIRRSRLYVCSLTLWAKLHGKESPAVAGTEDPAQLMWLNEWPKLQLKPLEKQ